MTAAERQRRAREKRKLMGIARGPGGLERVSELVVEKVRVGVQSGALKPTIKDGLMAEKIMDTRAAKEADRNTEYAIALLLAGGQGGFLAPPALQIEDGDTIEGEAVELD